jgi:hypothetical protein
MSRRPIATGLGVLLLGFALAVPAFAQPGWGMHGWAGPVTIDTAVDRLRQVLATWGNPDLVPKEIMEFSNHFYVIVVEKSTGIGAMELIVWRNGAVQPEPGPNMMWNTKYGHMAGGGMMGPGMMGSGWGAPGVAPGTAPAAQTVTKERAHQIASQYLQTALPGAQPDDGVAFYGYFTFDVERSGKTVGMLSVNAYTGQVWYHTWHGTFVREKHL